MNLGNGALQSTTTVLCCPCPREDSRRVLLTGDFSGSVLTYRPRKLGSNSGFDKHPHRQHHPLKATVDQTIAMLLWQSFHVGGVL